MYYFTRKLPALLLLAAVLICGKMAAQNVLVSGAVVGNGTYPTVGAAFTAINSGAQTGATIVVSIVGNTTEAATATLNAGAWTSMSIVPSGGVGRTVSGNIVGALISFNGADRVGVDGLNSGGNSLTFDNTNTGAASTVQFINDADFIAVQNATVLGAGTTTTLGTVFFSTASGTGNDSITFSACVIDASSGGNPVNGICSIGSAVAGQENGTIAINNCNIANFFSATAITHGIEVGTGSTDWTIQGCRFYQSASRNYTTGNIHSAIHITSGNAYVVNLNTIGYATSTATGTYTMTGAVATRFIGIDLAVGTTTATSVQGNVIRNFSLATSSGTATVNGVWCGINVTAGNVNIGTTSGNTIGASSGTSVIAVVSTATQAAVVGIHSSSTGAITIQNTTIGGLSSSGVTAAISGACFGVNISAAASTLSITGNTIGNSTADNMRAGTVGLTTAAALAAAINITTNPVGVVTITGNTIQNFSSYGTGLGYVRGLSTPLSTSTTAIYTVSNNIITNLTTSGNTTGMTSGQVVAGGIQFFAAGGSTISGNTISNISCTNTGTGQYVVAGITLAATAVTAGDNTISGNTIYNLSNAGTGTTATAPPVVAGIGIRSGASNNYNIQNNMISLGSGQTTNTAFVGIWANHGSTPNPLSDNIRFNTVTIEGTVAAGALSTFCFNRGDLTATQRLIPADVRNNIFTNNRTGGTGMHIAISNNFGATVSATGWSSNNNILNANAANVGWWGAAQTFAAWQSIATSDANSFSGITVTYVNPASNLHLNMGVTPTIIESNAQTITGINTDIDGQVRPGPVGSVNGGAFMPDIGADEFDGVPTDISAPSITYTALSFTCATTNRTLTATIADLSGVPTVGILVPRVYFRKNAGPWFSAAGTLITGTATNGTWDFIISTATMGGLTAGDIVSYYVIAQDVHTPTANIGSNPAAGLVASDVNTVTTAPTTPNSYSISSTLSGTYTVGATGNYTTLTSAVNAYNTSCLGGPVTFLLIDANYSASETFPISINANVFASSVNTLTIKPQNAGTVITGAAPNLIKLNGADYVTINGSSSSVVNSSCSPVVSASRDLLIENTSAAALSSAIWISSVGVGAGATHNTILNCMVKCGVDQSVTAGETYAIVSCGTTVTAFPPSDGSGNNYNVYENNEVVKATWGIYLRGAAVASNTGNIIRQNIVGPSAFGSDQVRKGGIILQHQDSASIIANEVRFVGNQISQTVGGTDHIGIGLGAADGPTGVTTNITNATVARNVVHDIVCEKTFSAMGIDVSAAVAGVTNNSVSNNIVYNVTTNATSPDQGIGINVNSGNGDKIVFNTVNLFSADRDPALSTTASQSDIGVRFQAGAVNVTFENNIVRMDQSSNTVTQMNFAVVAPSAAYTWAVSNYNDYSINAANPQNALFGLGTIGVITPVTTLAAWQTTFTPAQDANSITVSPVFTSSTDHHLMPGGNPTLENLAVPIIGYASDIDCTTRNATTPDMGADEACTVASVPTVSATPSALCAGDSSTITITAGSLNESTSWQWYSGSCGATPEGSGTSITVAPGTSTDYFVRGEGGCSASANCAMVNITVNPLPTVTASPVTTVCTGSFVTLTGNGTTSYVWNGPETVTDNTPYPAFIAGTYTVTGTDANGCMDTATVAVTLYSVPTVTASPSVTVVCAGGSVTLSGSGAVSYMWSGPEPVTDNTPFVPTISGTYSVTGIDANGCMSNPVTASVTVNALPTVAANVASQTVCAGSPVTLFGAGATSYSWNGPQAITDNVSFSATTSGTYTVTGTDANGCTNTDNSTITVNALPSVAYSEPVDTACQTTTVSFALSGETPAGGTWSGPGVSGNMFDPMTANVGYNVVTYMYTDSITGCMNMAMDSVWVDLCLSVVQVNGGTVISAYPNPNSGTFTLTIGGDCSELSIELMGVDGKTVYSNQQNNVTGSYTEQIDMTSFANGTYFLKVAQDSKVNVLKVVKSE